MEHLKKSDKDKYKKQFSKLDACLTKNKVSSLEALYKKIHQEIRKAPKRVKAARKHEPKRTIKKEFGGLVVENSKKQKWFRSKKLNKEQRKERVAAKIQKALANLA